MLQATPTWIWKIFTILVAITSPKGEYGHPGSQGHSPSKHHPGHPKTTTLGSPSSNHNQPTSGVLPISSSAGNGTVTPVNSTGSVRPTASQTISATSSSPSSTAAPIPKQDCPEGSEWFVVDDSFSSSVNKEHWNLDAANDAKIKFDDGMQMTLNQKALYVTLTSNYLWVPPVTVEAQIKATGVGGVPSALVMKGDADAGAEIDLEIVSYQMKNQQKPTYQMQLPIWKPSGVKGKDAIVLRKDGSELSAKTSNGCFEDKTNPAMSDWAYTYPGYDPRAWIEYKLEWFPKQIKWYSEGLERAAFENKKAAAYPSSPLPLRIGPWAVSKDSNPEVGWAGTIDWKAHPNPSMSLKNVRIAGCRAKN